jgi:hypothetical protein
VLVPGEIIQSCQGFDVAVATLESEPGDAGDQVIATLPGGALVAFRQHPDPRRWVAHHPGGSLHVAGAYQVVEALRLSGAATVGVPPGEPVEAPTWRRSA